MNKRHYEHTLPNIRGSLSNTYTEIHRKHLQASGRTGSAYGNMPALLQGRHSRVPVCPVPYVRNTGPSRLQDIHLCLENNPCPDCHGHACITIKYRRYENLHIYLLGSGHAGCMACHKPDNTCQKTASLYDRRAQTYRLLSGTVERHRLESGQAENPEGFFQGNLCITF